MEGVIKEEPEEERKRIQALKDAELEKVQDLLFDADRWRVSCLIKDYISAFEALPYSRKNMLMN